jgi:hypothetical protein
MRKPDKKFRAIYAKGVPWDEKAARELLTLPQGVKVKIFAHDPVLKRIDLKIKFPKGYVEPRHTHKTMHSILVTKGRMCVAGKDLRPGDYVFGADEPHGPYEYPDGCEVFTVMFGKGTQHIWDEDKYLHHQTQWTAKTSGGKKAVSQGESARRRTLQKKSLKNSRSFRGGKKAKVKGKKT